MFCKHISTLHFQLIINYSLPESSWQSGLSSKCLAEIAIQMFIFLSTSFYTNVFSLDLLFAASLLISQVADGALGKSISPSSLLWVPFFHYIPEYSIPSLFTQNWPVSIFLNRTPPSLPAIPCLLSIISENFQYLVRCILSSPCSVTFFLFQALFQSLLQYFSKNSSTMGLLE